MKHAKLFALIMLVCVAGTAQIRMSYSIGCVGNTNQRTAVFTSPFAIDGKACFRVSNGVRVFAIKKPGVFVSSCEVQGPGTQGANRKLSLVAYPNPVISRVTIKTKDFLFTDERVTLTMFSVSGAPVKTVSTSILALNTGIGMDMSGLANGNYVIRVLTSRGPAILNVIKID